MLATFSASDVLSVNEIENDLSPFAVPGLKPSTLVTSSPGRTSDSFTGSPAFADFVRSTMRTSRDMIAAGATPSFRSVLMNARIVCAPVAVPSGATAVATW